MTNIDLEFSLNDISNVEFGAAIKEHNETKLVNIAIKETVQDALKEIINNTWNVAKKQEGTPEKYEPSNKYESKEYVYLETNNSLAKTILKIHNACNIPMKTDAIKSPKTMLFYFTKMTDSKRNKITAMRRASQFKGILSKRLLSIMDDSLGLISDNVFKLDEEFDIIVDKSNIHIIHPRGFEIIGDLKKEIMGASKNNIESIKSSLSFIDFTSIESYSITHPRAARLVASICSSEKYKDIDKDLLLTFCERTDISISKEDDLIHVQPGNELKFLELLDRRLYSVALVSNKNENYIAGNRRELK